MLLAGGSGFVGKNIVEGLAAPCRIVVADRRIDRDFFDGRPNCSVCEVDLTDPAQVGAVVADVKPTHVVNLVSIVTAERDLSLFPQLVETNVRVLLAFYESLKQETALELFVQFGTAEEYGSCAIAPFSETMRESPDSPYALIKQLTTNTALMLYRNHGFPAVVVRPGNLYGRYQPEDKLIPYIYRSLMTGEDLLLTPGDQSRDFVYVKDFVEALWRILENPESVGGTILNVSYGQGIRVREVVEWMRKRLKSTSVVRYGAKEYRKNEIMDFRCDTSTLEKRVGFEFSRTGFDAFEAYVVEMGGGQR